MNTTMIQAKGTDYVQRWTSSATAKIGADALAVITTEVRDAMDPREIPLPAVTPETLTDAVGQMSPAMSTTVMALVRAASTPGSLAASMRRDAQRAASDRAWERQHDL